jgi:hypothetical protein
MRKKLNQKTNNSMKKLFALTLIALLSFGQSVKADEGMWLPFLLNRNYDDMKKNGLKLTAQEIYDINNSSLKDAIVSFGGFCTAEVISNQGLLLTNHHCGYDVIAEVSTPENNYLRDGFWAKSFAEELKPKSLFVRFLVRMDDVTKRVLAVVNDKMTEDEREAAINKEISAIQKEFSEGGKYVVSVRPFFQGNEYYYFVYEDYKDVRLVGTPTESIGKFGGDTDNWEWPRHTGDFALFRVYADKNNNPAEYSADNVPYRPKHSLPVNIAGVKEGDFAMILGYPGRTNRWMPAQGIDQNVKYAYPAWVEGSKTGMDAMKKHMDKDTKVRLDYASKYASVANYWKNRQGMIDALTQHKTAETKTKQEAAFNKWANKPENKAMYGDVVATINKYYAATNEKARHDNYLMTLFRTSAFGALPMRLGRQLDAYAKADPAKRKEMADGLRATIEETFESIYLPLEKDVLAAQLKLYSSKAVGHPLVPAIQSLLDRGVDFDNYVDNLFTLSVFTSKERLLAFINFPQEGMITNDPLYVLSSGMLDHYNSKSDEFKQLENDYLRSFRLLVDGLRKSNPKGNYYPDANSTLRLTYGKVRALPADKRNDAKINNYTTLQGMVAKHKEGDEEFHLSPRLMELYKAGDFGQYADKAGYMPVNFLTDNDITGGNSGSPVINGKGELIGLAFDGNIEAMAGDVIFDHKLQRTINVDIRFVLFIIEKYAGAKNLIDELKIVR